ncbi:hypothetical protein LZK73_11840 [Neorhizobium galegae]|nr:hypothetical protein LZK73_11840 [Neorhizobium galegae]
MIFRTLGIQVTLLLGLCGCVVHPLPENVAVDNTSMIVRKVVCEARDALLDQIEDYLTKPNRPDPTRRYGLSLRSQPTKLLDLKKGDLDPVTIGYLAKYEYGGIGFAFKLDMLENTNNAIALDLFNPFSNGTRTAALGTGVERQNQNIRNVEVIKTFRELIQLYDPEESDYCRGLSPRSTPLSYYRQDRP